MVLQSTFKWICMIISPIPGRWGKFTPRQLTVFIFVDTDGLMRGFPDTLVSGKSGFTGVYKPMEAIVTHTSIDFMQLVLTGTEAIVYVKCLPRVTEFILLELCSHVSSNFSGFQAQASHVKGLAYIVLFFLGQASSFDLGKGGVPWYSVGYPEPIILTQTSI